MNINRDYLIINDVKKSNVTLNNGSMFFYITDKNTQNIFVNLVINVSDNELIQKYANIENAEDYTLTMNIVKPDNDYKIIEGKLHDKEKAIFEFNLEEDCVDKIGTYKCELLTKCNINGHEEITTSNSLTYEVNSSILNDLDGIVEVPEYPLVIQLFDKLSDIEQYEENRRTNELARQLTEEQRQARFNALDTDMADRITSMDNKVIDVENRISVKENAVDALIANTETKIDEYKVAKDQEINNYKTLKDTEINNAITNQDNRITQAIANQDSKIDTAINTQNNRLDTVENRLDNIGNDITNTMQPIIDAHTSRLDAIELKNQQQDDRLLDIEKVNKRQDMDLKCLFAESKKNMIDITEEGNSIHLQNSTIGYTLIDEIQGNTLVNCNKEPDKELVLNGNINTSGDNTVTLTEGVDGGLVDVALEGNTLVNVSKTKDSTALPLNEELSYLYDNTQYAIQFASDVATTADVNLGGASLLAQNIVQGLNRITITTPATLADNRLIIDGAEANISNVVVTDTDRKFGYFEGMKSVGECEELEIISANSDNSLSNTQQLTHEPLRAVRDIKDRYVLLDGKWYIERKCGVRAYQEGDKDNYKTDLINTVYPLTTTTYEPIDYKPIKVHSDITHITTNSTIPTNIVVKNHGFNCLLKPSTTYTISSNLGLNTVTTPSALTEDCLRFMDTDTSNVTTMKNVLVLEGDWTSKANLIPANFSGIESAFEQKLVTDETDEHFGKYRVNAKVVGKNLFDKNSNFIQGYYNTQTGSFISNSGYKTFDYIKVTPNTSYCRTGVSENRNYYFYNDKKEFIGGNFVSEFTTPTNCHYIRVTLKVNVDDPSNVQIEQGSTATAYEPYQESNITFYIDEPLRGTATAKDKIFIKDNKVIVERKCGGITLDRSNYLYYELESTTPNYLYVRVTIPNWQYNKNNNLISNILEVSFSNRFKINTSLCYYRISATFKNQFVVKVPIWELGGISGESVARYIESKKIKIAYELLEPVYEEIEYDNTKLLIESFKNSVLFYNSNVPVTSTVHYSYSVPIVDTVAHTASISDEQDVMIIDLATQVAVMEMMLM